MKKTLITLAVLAASTAAAVTVPVHSEYTYEQDDFTNGTVVLPEDLKVTGAYSWTMQYDVVLGTGSYASDGSTVLFEVGNMGDFGSGKGFMAYVTNSGNDTYTLSYAFRTDLPQDSPDRPAGNNMYELVTFENSYTLKAGDLLTFTFQNAPETETFIMSVDVIDFDGRQVLAGHTYTRQAPSNNLRTFGTVETAIGRTGADASMADWEVSRLKVSGTSIPEPATATLSLLALAGLAARRRRK